MKSLDTWTKAPDFQKDILVHEKIYLPVGTLSDSFCDTVWV